MDGVSYWASFFILGEKNERKFISQGIEFNLFDDLIALNIRGA